MTEPRRGPRAAHVTTVQRTQRLSQTLTRVVVGGPGLAGFSASPFTDSYVKLAYLRPEVPRPLPLTGDGRVDLDAAHAGLGREQGPRMRTYTVRGFDADALEMTLDFVVHGDEGLAGPWAASAQPGDELLLLGPGGGYAPDPGADVHLLVADTSALPAVAVALEQMPSTAVGTALIEVPGPQDEIPLTGPAGIEVVWVHQGDAPAGVRLVEAVRTLPWPAGDVQGFVHGEAGTVRELRRYLRGERGMGLDRLSISGYWRLGADDEAWRAAKREWNAAIEADETVAAG